MEAGNYYIYIKIQNSSNTVFEDRQRFGIALSSPKLTMNVSGLSEIKSSYDFQFEGTSKTSDGRAGTELKYNLTKTYVNDAGETVTESMLDSEGNPRYDSVPVNMDTGAWTMPIDDQDGTYAYTFISVSGDFKTTESHTITLDTTPPTVEISSINQNSDGSAVTADGIADDNLSGLAAFSYCFRLSSEGEPGENDWITPAGISAYSWRLNGSNSINTSSKPEGEYKLYVKVTDKAGNSTVSHVNGDLTLDKYNPELLIKVYDATKTFDETPVWASGTTASWQERKTLKGTATDTHFESLTVKYGDEAAQALNVDSEHNWTWTPPENIEDGVYSVTFTVRDSVGKTREETRSFVIDRNGPVLEVLNLDNGGIYTSGNSASNPLVVRGTATDTPAGSASLSYSVNNGAYVEVYPNSEYPNSVPANWRMDISGLSEGSNTLRIKAVDKSGNSAERIYTGITVDFKPPKFKNGFASSAPNYIKVGDSPFKIITATDSSVVVAEDTIAIDSFEVKATKDNIPQTPRGAATGNESWYSRTGLSDSTLKKTLTVGDLAIPDFTGDIGNGNWVVTVNVYDKSGWSASKTYSFTVDTTPPVVDAIEDIAAPKDMGSISYMFSGSANDSSEENGSGVKIVQVAFTDKDTDMDEDTVIYPASGQADWNYTLVFGNNTAFNTEGQKDIHVRAVDTAGNVGEWTKKSFLYDKNAPTSSISSYKAQDAADFTALTSSSFYTGKAFTLKGKAYDSYQGIASVEVWQKNGTANAVKIATISEDELSTLTDSERTASDPAGTQGWTLSNLPRNADNTGASLVDGEYTFYTVVMDKSGITKADGTIVPGKTITSSEVKVTVDTTSPTVDITAPDNTRTGLNALSGSSYIFSVDAEDSGSVAVGASQLKYAFVKAKTDAFGSDSNPETPNPAIPDAPSDWQSMNITNGSWSITQSLAEGTGSTAANTACATGTLNEGHWYLFVKALDKAGNESEVKSVHFHVDMAAPGITDVQVDGVTAKENSSYYTGSTSFALSGKARDTYGITSLSISTSYTDSEENPHNATQDITSSIADDGSWSYTLDLSAENAANTPVAVTIKALDKAGKTVEKKYTLYRDTLAPEVQAISPADRESLSSNTIRLKGTAVDAGSGVASISYTITRAGDDDFSRSASGILPVGESWNVAEEINLGDDEGTFTLIVNAIDKVSNTNSEASLATRRSEFYVDTANPSITETGINSAAKTVQSYFTLSGFVYDSNALSADEAVTLTADAAGFTPVRFLLPGSSATGTVMTQVTESNREALGAKANQIGWYKWEKTFIVGSETAGGTAADGTSLPLDAIHLDDGSYVFSITVKDVASKTAVVQRTITVDTRAPAFTASEGGSIIDYTDTGAGNIKVVGTGDNAQTWFTVSVVNLKVIAEDRKISDSEDAEEGSGLSTVKYETSDGKSGFLMKSSAAGSNEWSTSIPLNEGSGNGIRIIAVDAAGNTTAYPAPALDGTAQYETIRIDTQNPTISLSDISDLLTGNEEFQLNGSASDGSLGSGIADVRVSLADSEGAPVSGSFVMDSTPAGGNWAITFRTSKSSETENKLSDGRYLVTITAEDKAGRTASVSKNVTVDTSAPAFVSSAFTSTSYPNSGSTGSETWYGSSSLDMSGVYTDSNSIETVMWSWTNTAGSTWHSFDKSLSGNNDSGYTCSFSGTVPVSTSLKNGSLYIKALDKAGNESAPQPVTGINVDLGYPTLQITQPVGTPLLNGASDLEIKVRAEDTFMDGDESVVASGVKGVKLKIGSQNFASPDLNVTDRDENNIFTLTIPSTTINALGDDVLQSNVYIQAEDNTGKTQITSFAFQIDKNPPTAEITSPYTESVLNKNIKFTGRANDDQNLLIVNLYYTTAKVHPGVPTEENVFEKTAVTTLEAEAEAATTKWVLFQTFEGSNGYNWDETIDTTLARYNNENADGKSYIHFMAEAFDAANNSGDVSRAVSSCTIDQMSDCPEITFSNVKADDHGLLKSTQTIFGTIEDDDGNIKELRVSSNSNASWDDNDSTVCVVRNGSWSYTDTGMTDGDKVLYFRVIDAKDSVFVTPSSNASEEELLSGIYISGTEDNPVKQMKALKFRIDMNPPQINQQSFKISSYKTGDTAVAYADADEFTNNMILGGTKNLVDFFASSYDANGIKSMSVKIGSQTINGENTGDKDGNGNYIWKMSGIDVSKAKLTDDAQTLTVTAVDSTNSDNSVMLKVRIDNTAPTFSVTSHQNDEERNVTGIVTLRGTASDTIAGVKSIKYMIPTSASAESIDASTDTVDNKWHDMVIVGTTTWKVEFKNYQDTDGEEPDLTTSELKEYCNSTYAEETAAGSGIWKVPVYFRMEDTMGNTSVDKSFLFFVNPDGDKPTARITFPATGSKLGGTIRIFGSAEDNEAVDSVYMQIDADGNGSFDDSDKEDVAAYQKDGVAIYTVEEFGTGTPDDASDDWWGIKVSGKESWNQTINAAGEFNPESGTKTINIRVRAKDLNGLLGAWSSSVSIEIDKNAPRIGSSSPLKLVQYDASGNVTAMQDYQTDISVKGNWYLTGSAEDESGIKEISVNPSQGTLQVLNGSEWTDFSVSSDSTPIIFRIPINTTGSGAKNFAISAKENTEQNLTTSQTVSIKYDNTAPTIGENLKHNTSSIIGDGKNDTIVIEQSNKTFSIEGSVEDEDDGSGFSRLAIYFKRVGSGSDSAVRIYNPAISKDETGNRTDIDGSTIKMVNGLPTFETVVTRDAENSLTLTGTLDPNIRAGGLVRIGGVYRRITSVSGNTVSFTPSVSTDYTTAEFVYALVVDNFKIETPVYDDATGALTKISNDDGDGVIESIEKIGTICEWSVSIDSKQIPDGPIDICCVAFDTADNFSDVKSVSTSVQNNRPAIANVWLGTDYDRDNSVSDNEFVKIRNVVLDSSDLLNYDPNWKNTASSVPLRDVANEFKAVGATVIKTEVIGGNGSLHYYYAKDKDSLASFKSIDTETAYVETESSTSDGTISKINFKVSGEESSATLDGLPNGIHSVYFRVYDTTENLVTGQDTMTENTSQWASFAIKFNVNVVDEVPPEATIKEFYWNGKNDNSLYNNSTAKGHIELKADLEKVAAFNATSGLMDTDPKVSGIIKIQGTAKDETCLQSILLKFDNYPGLEDFVKLSEFRGSSWTESGVIETDGYHFKVTDPDGVRSTGHEVTWQLDLDTSKIPHVADVDKSVHVKVEDSGGNDNSKKAVYDENGKVTSVIMADIPSYRMDIVPYITGVKTSLSSLKKNNPSVYSRTVAGHYPVAAGEEKITITGFNLTGGTVTFIPMDETVTDEADYTVAYSAEGITIPEKVKSGEVSIVVNEIESLNNKNGNESKGAYSGVVDKTVTPTGDKDIYDNYYNRQPNGDNNNLLTDDVVFDIWDINSSAAMTNRGLVADAVMKINPTNGMIGFAFSNGPDYFCMPNGSTNSYVNWQRNYDDYYWTALAYDDKGRTFGTTVGRDINSNSNHGGKFSFLTSVWGLSKTNDTTGNYKGGSQRRLECIGAPNGAKVLGTATTEAILDKTRIRSPSLAVAGHGDDDTSVYLAYYDDIYQQIRFRYAKTISAKVDNYDQIYDDASTDAVNVSGEAHYSIISGYGISDYSITDTPEKGIGEYVSIAVIPGETYETDVVVAVWYDNSNDCTWYSYKVNPCNDNDRDPETKESGYWSDPVKVFQGAGQYCQVAVGGNGIHVAAYDGTDANLVYAYMSSYSGEAFTTCTVDSYSITGTRITLDVVNTGTAAAPVYVPYIGYYMSSTLRPKMAYLPGGVANLGDGVDTNYDTFTYRWESTLIPTSSTMIDERINVATWKDTSGLLKTNETTMAEISEKTSSAEAGSGTCYGNGSNNPVMGYAIKKSTTGFIETAQLR